MSKEELINRKIQQISAQDKSPSTLQQNQLKVKQKSTRALRSKSPVAYSPGVKQKRQAAKDGEILNIYLIKSLFFARSKSPVAYSPGVKRKWQAAKDC